MQSVFRVSFTRVGDDAIDRAASLGPAELDPGPEAVLLRPVGTSITAVAFLL